MQQHCSVTVNLGSTNTTMGPVGLYDQVGLRGNQRSSWVVKQAGPLTTESVNSLNGNTQITLQHGLPMMLL